MYEISKSLLKYDNQVQAHFSHVLKKYAVNMFIPQNTKEPWI